MLRHSKTGFVALVGLLAAGGVVPGSPLAPASTVAVAQTVVMTAPVSYALMPFDVPENMGSFTSAYGNNNWGTIVGNFAAPDGSAHGFLYQRGTFVDVVVPGAGPGDLGTLLDINDLGTAVGAFDENDNTHMFLRDWRGRITVLPDPAPDAVFAEALGINNWGTLVGFYNDANGSRHGFIRRFGRYERYDYPGAVRTVLTAVNDRNDILGYWTDVDGRLHGFILRRGQPHAVDVPDAVNTRPGGINNRGEVSGYFRGADGVLHGFFHADGGFTVLDFPDALNTNAFGLNDRGVIVGTYDDFSRGFVAVPVRD